jgi:hypothetical protein
VAGMELDMASPMQLLELLLRSISTISSEDRGVLIGSQQRFAIQTVPGRTGSKRQAGRS